MKKKVIFVTGSRADYGLQRKLIQLFLNDPDYETTVAATAAHLTAEHGHTVELVREDVKDRLVEVSMDLSGDKAMDICSAISVGTRRFSELYSDIQPDFIVLLGDRFELWSACMPAAIFNLPIVHIHGGESTRGVIDEAIRHSITKMSHLHFCTHEEYRQRILRMGEQPDRVHVVGAPGLDRIREMQFSSREQLEQELDFKFSDTNILFTFHPVTLGEQVAVEECEAMVAALESILTRDHVKLFITLPNADTYSGNVRDRLKKIATDNQDKVRSFINLGDQLYLSMMKQVDLVLGNSSSGIIEAPFLKTAVVDVGVRQSGRLRSEHVVHAEGQYQSIMNAFERATAADFQNKLSKVPSIYGDGQANEKIYAAIRNTEFRGIIHKIFNDGSGYA